MAKQLSTVLESGSILSYKKGGTGETDGLPNVGEVETQVTDLLSGGTLDSIKKGGATSAEEVTTSAEVDNKITTTLAGGGLTSINKGGTGPENEVLNKGEMESLRPTKAFFIGTSKADINLSVNSSAPSYFPMDDSFMGTGFTLINATQGIVRNTSGRDLGAVTGSFNFTPQKDGSGTTVLAIVSERSTDGVTWVPNLDSLRTFELKRGINQFGTKLSYAFDWLDGEYIRFKAYASSSLSLESSSEVIEGDTYESYSWIWMLLEQDITVT